MAVRTSSPFIFSLLFLFFTLNLPLSLASDAISANQSLTGNQTLVSANGNFELGFYQPGNSSNYYICIVYKKVSLQTIAWVANRHKPISDKYSSVLKIIDGNLVLLNEAQIPIWSTNQYSTASNSVVAVLGGDGNFVLQDGFNSTQPLWQSFDFPGNTFLPGNKIGYNKRTKTHQYLTSWKNSEDPSDGLFALSLDASNKQYVILRTGSEQYLIWASGPWNGQIFTGIPQMSFNGVPEMRANYIYNFTFVDNENESYFMYWLYDPSIISRCIMDVSGQVQVQTWLEFPGQWMLFWAQPREQWAFQTCDPNIQPLCTSSYGFSHKGKNTKGVIIGVVASSVAVVLLGLVLILFWKRQRRFVRKIKTVEGFLVAVGYKDLQIATKNFSEKLGGGGFGSVFKGILPDSTVIAVKKLESISQGEKQFRTEVSTIGTIQHANLVRLQGFCSEGNQKLLVYDYMSNGSLDSHLFRKKEGQVLDWKTRYEIALGTARGLTYLHEKCRDCIIHCDIKPENILLDAEFCPKVADFGLAKLIGREFSRALTTMRGTIGYLAPEWISGVAITAKADVYSYGMMLFELVSGRRNSEQSQDKKFNFFPTWAASVVVEGGDVFNLLDHRLENNADEEELRRIARVACWCIQDAENHRPTMGQVVQILEGLLEVNLPRVPRLLQAFTDSSSEQSSQPPS